jgi:hypothetical protein
MRAVSFDARVLFVQIFETSCVEMQRGHDTIHDEQEECKIYVVVLDITFEGNLTYEERVSLQ